MPVVNWSDPRLQPWAYVARGPKGRQELFEILEVDRVKGILVENCRDGGLLRVGPREIVPGWTLVRPAPDAAPVAA